MKIFTSIKSGISGSLKSWKGSILVWFSSLVLISLLAIPLRSIMITGFGNSMITDKLLPGINVEVFADLGASLKNLISSFSSGLLMLVLAAFLLNSFLTAGLFNSIKGSSGTFAFAEFFRASSKYFWSFITISLIISLIVLFLAVLIIIISVLVLTQTGGSTEEAIFKTSAFIILFFLLILALMLLVADYARAWQVSHNRSASFKAIAFGFSLTFRTFKSSYTLMLILIVVQLLYGWLVLSLLPVIRPVTETGIILLFILSQSLFIIKIFLKVGRYGSITRMMELNTQLPSDI